MAIINFTGFEVTNGGNGGEFSGAPSGTTAYSTSTVRTGNQAFRVNPTTTAVGYCEISGIGANGRSSLLGEATMYYQFWFRYATKPSSGDEEIFVVRANTGVDKLSIRIDSAGNLVVYNSVPTAVGTSATALSANTWYKIEVQCGTSATVGAYDLKIGGVSEVSGTTNTTATSGGSARLGKVINRNGNSVDFFYDDFASSNTGFISGNIEVKQMTPDANGSTMSWTAGTGTSDYTTVDESPAFDDTDYVQSLTGAGAKVALFDLQTSSAAGITGNILAVKGYVHLRENTSVTSAYAIRIRSNTTNSDSSNNNGSTAAQAYQRLLETDPDTSTAWTTGGLDALEVGGVENNAVATRLTYARVFILTSVTPTSSIKTVLGLARASVKTDVGLAIASVKNRQGLA